MRTTRGILFSLFSTLCVRSAFSRPQACDTRILRTCVWAGRKQLGGHAPTAKFQQKKLWEVTCVAGAKRGGRERKGNPMALPSSLLLNPLPPFLPTLRALYESKKRKGFWSFRFLNRETLRTRLRTTTKLPLTSGDIQKQICTSYTIMIAISQQTKGKERWRSFFAVQLVPSYTEFSRETVVRLALGECILWHSYLFHNPLRSIRKYSGCIYTLPLQLWAFFWVEWAYFVCIVLFSRLLLIIKHKTCSVIQSRPYEANGLEHCGSGVIRAVSVMVYVVPVSI